MADFRALTFQQGSPAQIYDPDQLGVGAGIKTLNGSLTITAANDAIVLASGTSLASGKSLTATGGASGLDFSAASGTFKTSTGAVSVNGDATVAAGKNLSAAAGAGNLDWSASTGLTKTGSGAVSVNGDTTLASGKSLTAAGGASNLDFSASSGLTKTGTGAVSLNGDVTLAANKSVSVAAGTSAIDFSGGSGIFKTTTGAVTIGPGAVTVSGAMTITAAGTGLTVNNNATFAGNVSIGGNLTVTGSTFATSAEQVLIDDNHLYLNNGYAADAAQTGGLVINYDPTTLVDTVAGVYVAGVAATSNPTVVTTGSATFAAGDLIQFSAPGTRNPGLFEVLSHVGTTLTIKGVGTSATAEDFTQNQFVAGASDAAAITKVAVSVLRAGTDGVWETGKGSTTPLTFTDLSAAGATTLQSAYAAGNTITTSGGSGNLTINGTEDLVIAGSVDFNMTSTGGFAAAALTGVVNVQTTAALTVRGGGVSIFGDDTAAFSFNGTGTLTTTGLVAGSITPSGALTLTAGAASTWSTSAGALTITSAAACTWSTTAGALTLTSAAAATWSSAAGALTITSAAAATWSTAAGALSLSGFSGINLQVNGASILAGLAASLTVQAGVVLSTTGSGNINLPNNGSARFQIEGTAVGSTVTAPNLDTNTNGGDASALHYHQAAPITGLTTTLVTTGLAGYVSAANTLAKTDASAAANAGGISVKARYFGSNVGTAGQAIVNGVVLAITTGDTAAFIGKPIYLAKGDGAGGGNAGKLEHDISGFTTPDDVVAEVGIILERVDATHARVLIQVKPPVRY